MVNLDYDDATVRKMVKRYAKEYHPTKTYSYLKLIFTYHCRMDKLLFDEICSKIKKTNLNFQDALNNLNIQLE